MEPKMRKRWSFVCGQERWLRKSIGRVKFLRIMPTKTWVAGDERHPGYLGFLITLKKRLFLTMTVFLICLSFLFARNCWNAIEAIRVSCISARIIFKKASGAVRTVTIFRHMHIRGAGPHGAARGSC